MNTFFLVRDYLHIEKIYPWKCCILIPGILILEQNLSHFFFALVFKWHKNNVLTLCPSFFLRMWKKFNYFILYKKTLFLFSPHGCFFLSVRWFLFFFNRNFGQSSNFNSPIASIQNINTALQCVYFFESRLLRDGRLPNVVNL